MAPEPLLRIRIQREDFDVASEVARLGETGAGAIVTFSGLCRDENGRLAALELEHYPGMAEAEIARIAREALDRWPLLGLTAIHRHGLVRPGENIVLVAAASRHREEAFAAAAYLMDFLKSLAPFWKKEHPASGEPGGWVDARESDEKALERWSAVSHNTPQPVEE